MMFMNNLHKIYIYYRVLFGSELRDNFGMEARFKSDLHRRGKETSHYVKLLSNDKKRQ